MKQLLIILLLLPIAAMSQKDNIVIVNVMTQKDAHQLANWDAIRKDQKYYHEYNDYELMYAVILSNGDTVVHNKPLKLGKGSLPNGDFNYIATPSNTMEAKLKRTTSLKEIWLMNIIKKGDKKYGFKYVFKAEGNYLIQLEDAVTAGEIVLK
jgi:hypothetical protein